MKDRPPRPVLLQELWLWYYPPGPRQVYHQRLSTPDTFFHRPFFLWALYCMWQYHLKCPNCAHKLTDCLQSPGHEWLVLHRHRVP